LYLKRKFKCFQILVFNPFCDGDTFVAEDRSESENGPRGHHQDCGGSHPHSLRNFTPQNTSDPGLAIERKKGKSCFVFKHQHYFFGLI
jgi:hypothetical protein